MMGDRPFYGAECPSYPACKGGCGLGCTKKIDTVIAARNFPAIRAAQIHLVAADGAQLVSAGIVVAGDEFPEIVMWSGEPFLRDLDLGPAVYRRVRAYRLDVGA